MYKKETMYYSDDTNYIGNYTEEYETIHEE